MIQLKVTLVQVEREASEDKQVQQRETPALILRVQSFPLLISVILEQPVRLLPRRIQALELTAPLAHSELLAELQPAPVVPRKAPASYLRKADHSISLCTTSAPSGSTRTSCRPPAPARTAARALSSAPGSRCSPPRSALKRINHLARPVLPHCGRIDAGGAPAGAAPLRGLTGSPRRQEDAEQAEDEPHFRSSSGERTVGRRCGGWFAHANDFLCSAPGIVKRRIVRDSRPIVCGSNYR